MVLGGNCLLGDLGELAGEEREEQRGRRRRAGEGVGAPEAAPVTLSSSGSGPRMDPPLAELTPDMADTEYLSASEGLDLISEF